MTKGSKSISCILVSVQFIFGNAYLLINSHLKLLEFNILNSMHFRHFHHQTMNVQKTYFIPVSYGFITTTKVRKDFKIKFFRRKHPKLIKLVRLSKKLHILNNGSNKFKKIISRSKNFHSSSNLRCLAKFYFLIAKCMPILKNNLNLVALINMLILCTN